MGGMDVGAEAQKLRALAAATPLRSCFSEYMDRKYSADGTMTLMSTLQAILRMCSA
jgi:lactam utilization protein B